jgi:SAM-dependent methyltransferase
VNCRHCGNLLKHRFLDLGFAPPSNAYRSQADLQRPEVHFPLRLFVCDSCWLVQTEDYASAAELFQSDYAYFSSVSSSWLAHAQEYTERISHRLGLDEKGFVVEIASNDGYLLKNFVAKGVPCLGIEPTTSTADAARSLGIEVLEEFFGEALADRLVGEGRTADLVIGNNVFAHVPDINDFAAGIRQILKPNGVVTLEFPHLMRLMELGQFDTVYHEHYSYLSLHAVRKVFERAGLRVWDVEELSTHGGSLRVYGCRAQAEHVPTDAVARVLRMEQDSGLQQLQTYTGFQRRVESMKLDLLSFLIEQKRQGNVVAAYGAAAKGNTFLNYAGIGSDLIAFVCDAAPAKQGKLMPGSHIPIMAPQMLKDARPPIVVVLPWNIADEVVSTHAYVREWGGRFFVAVPKLREIA